MKKKHPFVILFFLIYVEQLVLCKDITAIAFGSETNIRPAAFGDFNADELTDLFIINNNGTKVEILLATSKEPYFQTSPNLTCELDSAFRITSVVPGDFDGDKLMDVLVTARNLSDPQVFTNVFIHWGGLSSSGVWFLHCTKDVKMKMIDEPLVIVYNQSLKTDLFGVDANNVNSLWLLKNRSSTPIKHSLITPSNFTMRNPHSHAFVDMNDDNSPDLVLTCNTGYEIWLFDNIHGFTYSANHSIPYPQNLSADKVGQNLFMDLETKGEIFPIVPVCLDSSSDLCVKSAIFARVKDEWYDLRVKFQDTKKKTWGFVPKNGRAYTDTITLRAGDFNNDGYVDLLATLSDNPERTANGRVKTFLLENVPCTDSACKLKRTFQVQWDALQPCNDHAVMGTFFDFFQDGILDIIFVRAVDKYTVTAFKNDLDYDANFVKVMVVSGLTNKESILHDTILSQTTRAFGTNLPGPKVQYKTTTQDGDTQIGIASQIPQSAHFAMYLPYTIFGLGRTPNFIEDLTVGMFNGTKTFPQIIPNSQLVVIPYPPDKPYQWRAQLFVTPSKIIVQTVIALTGTCVVIALIICILHLKERKEDRLERLQESQRFHFDAM